MKRNICRKIAGLLLVSFLASCASTPEAPVKPPIEKDNYAYLKAHLDWLIRDEMRRHKITGVNIAIVHKDRTVWTQSFGQANLKPAVELNATHRFRAGSLAKFINALAVVSLEQAGKLKLDAPISDWIPELAPNQPSGKPISLRQLLTHQSGLPSDLVRGMWVENPKHFKSVLQYLNEIYSPWPSDTFYNYSNLGFDVVGTVIERASGQPYEEFIDAFIKKLGLNNSAFSPSPLIPETIPGFYKHKPEKTLSLRDVPAAGLTTDIDDLSQLVKIGISETVPNVGIDSQSYQKIFEDYSSDKPLNFQKRVGLGIFYYDGIYRRPHRLFGHDGATPKHRSLIKFSREYQYGVALLSNSTRTTGNLNHIANKALELLHEATQGKPAPRLHTFWPKPDDNAIIDDEKLLGVYATSGGMAKIFKRGDKLKVSIAGKTLDLYQREEGGLYYVRYRFLGLIPIPLGYFNYLAFSLTEIDGKQLLVSTNLTGQKSLWGEKLEPYPIPEVWRKRVGRYRIVDPLQVLDIPEGGIKIKNGFLVAFAKIESGEKIEVILKPVSDDRAVVAGLARGLGESVYVVETHKNAKNKQGEVQLKYSNVIFERL